MVTWEKGYTKIVRSRLLSASFQSRTGPIRPRSTSSRPRCDILGCEARPSLRGNSGCRWKGRSGYEVHPASAYLAVETTAKGSGTESVVEVTERAMKDGEKDRLPLEMLPPELCRSFPEYFAQFSEPFPMSD